MTITPGLLFAELRYVLRGLRTDRSFAAAASGSLALAIGATTAVFAALDATVLRPLDVPRLRDLAVITSVSPGPGGQMGNLSVGELLDLARRDDLFRSVAGHAGTSATLYLGDTPSVEYGARTYGAWFATLGLPPDLGRYYGPEDAEPGRPRVVVLSHALWRRAGGDSSIVGRSIELDGVLHRVVGVAPRQLRHPRNAAYWIPAQRDQMWEAPMRGARFMNVLVRLRNDVSAPALRDALARETDAWEQRFGGGVRQTLLVTPLTQVLAGDLRPVLWALMAAVVLVLLIAALNVSALQFVRGIGHANDLAVRSVLGASSVAIGCHIMLDNAVIAVVGGAGGVSLAHLFVKGAALLAPVGSPLRGIQVLEPVVLILAAGLVMVVAISIGAVAAWNGRGTWSGSSLVGTHRAVSLGADRHRLLRWSIVAQVAAAVVLITATALMSRTLKNLLGADPGFVLRNATVVTLSLPRPRYTDSSRVRAFHHEFLDRIRSLPGIDVAAHTNVLPFSGGQAMATFTLPWLQGSGNQPSYAQTHIVSADYFRAMGIPLRRGRPFTSADDLRSTPVVIVDEAFIKTFARDQDVLGRVLEQFGEATIIGIVGSIRGVELGQSPRPTVYYSADQFYSRQASIVVRGAGASSDLARRIHHIAAELDANLPPPTVTPMQDLVDATLAPRRLALGVLSAFALVAAFLAATGIFGVFSYATRLRRREIGIRIALGASPRRVAGAVMSGALRLALIGVFVGIPISIWACRGLETLLYGVSASDPWSLLVALSMVLFCAVVASAIPAWRTSSIEPAEIARQ